MQAFDPGVELLSRKFPLKAIQTSGPEIIHGWCADGWCNWKDCRFVLIFSFDSSSPGRREF
jgi:hypothetical protein